MDEFCPRPSRRNRLERGPAKENESFAVVFVVLPVFAIELGPIVVLRLVHEIHRHLSPGSELRRNVPGTVLRPIGTSKRITRRFNRPAAIERLAKRRQDDDRLVSQPRQFERQAAAHIAQAARLTEGNRLARSEQDFHNLASKISLAVPLTAIVSQ